ncbi:ligase [Photobacterium kishitanii]|uniref:PglL family O-oligosaccharyltransferase n=1 Tax=Photobacterium kishitanii TaxID=318456 RepID=UPI000D15F072|nr:Wzy polymerase domain-containing protein [Photobacterium kishitanii]PSW60410.1 ligase [Photobacterium kishitanii]
MTVLQLQGTKLEQKRISKPLPLVRFFLASVGLLFIVAMHYFQHNPGGSGLELSFNAAAWIPFSVAISCGLLEICRQKVWRYSRMTLLLFSCCVLLTLPVFYANADGFAASNRLLTLWAGFLFFASLQQFVFTHSQRQRLLWFITIAVLIEAMFGWYQFLWLTANNRFGYDIIANRPYGIFQQPNVMASFLATGLVIAAYLLARLPRYRGKWVWQHMILLAVPVLTIPLLVVLNSRTGWLGATIGSLLMLPYLYRFAAKYQQRMWGLMLLLGLALAWQVSSTTDSSFSHQARITLESQRSIMMPQTYEMFTSKPLTGYGYGKFEAAYITQTALWHHQDSQQYPAGVASLDHPHNELLYWAAEGGIIPLLGLILAALAVLVSIKKAPNGTQLALVGLFFPIVLHTQLEYPFYHSLAHWIVFIILIFWVDNLTAKYHRYQTQYVLALKISAIALPVMITSFMITTLYSGWLLTKFETTRPVDINYLVKVNNPWAWQHRFEWDLHLTQLQLGIATDKPQLVADYVHWANQKAQTWPRPALYQNLVLAYYNQGKTAQAEQVATEAQQLFPGISLPSTTTAATSSAK